MNELIFGLHLLLVIFFIFVSCRVGREALITAIVTCDVLANLFVLKQVELFSHTVTCTDVFAIGSIAGITLLQEFHGEAIARRTLWFGFMVMVFVALFSTVHLWYVPSPWDKVHSHFSALFLVIPRILVASLTAFFISGRVDILLNSFLRRRFSGRYFSMRSSVSMVISELLDTILFSVLGLYGHVYSLSSIIVASFGIKMITVAGFVPFMVLARRLVPASWDPARRDRQVGTKLRGATVIMHGKWGGDTWSRLHKGVR